MADDKATAADKIFRDALKIPPEAREAFLSDRCAGDSELRTLVEGQLRGHVEGEPATLEDAPTQARDRHHQATTLGPYRLHEKLGEGGFAEVYAAEQSEPVKRRVALKILKAGMDTKAVLARFAAERQALAIMDHPNISKVLDAGETGYGRSYFVMELIQGEPITDYCDRHRLSTRERLELFVTVCQAIHHAHTKGVVHRDVKPSNVLVTTVDGKPAPKVIDFGIAKATAQPLTEKTIYTAQGQLIGTPAYMSPEQVEMRGDVDARTDVYSLGVLLYELLTGSVPFDTKTLLEAGFESMPRIIRETEPPKPSTRITSLEDGGAQAAEQRQTQPARLASFVRGELDWITMKALEKDRTKRYETVNRLMRDVERHLNDEAVLAGPPSVSYRIGKLANRHRVAMGFAAIAFVGLVLGAGGWWLLSRRAPGPPKLPVKITPITFDGGFKGNPSLSPDGSKVAYNWAGPSGDDADIYVQAFGRGTKPLRLTEHAGSELSPTWSPDGQQIAFVRELGDERSAIYTMSSLGGGERKVIDRRGDIFGIGDIFLGGLSWSPDGAWLAYSERSSDDEPARIHQVSLETGEKRALTSPPEGSVGDVSPAFSPDGRLVAFARSNSTVWGAVDVWVQPLDGGDARQVTVGKYDLCRSLTWTSDGREIVFGRSPGGVFRVRLEGGEPEPVIGLGRNASGSFIRGERMVFEEWTVPAMDLWRIPGRHAGSDERVPERLIVSSGRDNNPAYSPDGRKIAFSSTRSGVENIWVCDGDGTNPVQMTDFAAHSGSPSWSPDGRQIVFDSAERGDWNLYVLDVEGGPARRLTSHPLDENIPCWSRDGRWVYFQSERSGTAQIWKVPAEGGEAIQVTQGGGAGVQESSDGRYVYYAKSTEGRLTIWRVSTKGGDETEVYGGPIRRMGWVLAQSGIYLESIRDAVPFRGEEYTIEYLDLESGRKTELYRTDESTHFWMTVSPDEEWIVFGEQWSATSELMLVENFR